MKSLSLVVLSGLGLSAFAQEQNVQFNQVVNINGDLELNRLVFPDGTVIETFSQEQQQLLVNQVAPAVPANNVVGSSGEPFVQVSPQAMVIATNGATDLVGAQIAMPLDANVLAQLGVPADNTFVAQLSPDRQAWIVAEDLQTVNLTDGTTRMVKQTEIDGEYILLGRQTVETGQSLTPFGNGVDNTVIVQPGIQESEFTDGFRVSLKAVQPMAFNTDVINGVAANEILDGSQPVNNFRYLVTSNLAGVQPDLNRMAAVVQIPLNAERVVEIASAMGAGPDDVLSLGIQQKGVLQNPGGVVNQLGGVQQLQGVQRRQLDALRQLDGLRGGAEAEAATPEAAVDEASAAELAATTTSAEVAESVALETTSAEITETAAAENVETASVSSTESVAAEATQDAQAQQQQQQLIQQQQQLQQQQLQQGQALQNQVVTSQVLLEPNFNPVPGQVAFDAANSRLAVPVAQIDGEFIITMQIVQQQQLQQQEAQEAQQVVQQQQEAQAAAAAAPELAELQASVAASEGVPAVRETAAPVAEGAAAGAVAAEQPEVVPQQVQSVPVAQAAPAEAAPVAAVEAAEAAPVAAVEAAPVEAAPAAPAEAVPVAAVEAPVAAAPVAAAPVAAAPVAAAPVAAAPVEAAPAAPVEAAPAAPAAAAAAQPVVNFPTINIGRRQIAQGAQEGFVISMVELMDMAQKAQMGDQLPVWDMITQLQSSGIAKRSWRDERPGLGRRARTFKA